MVPLFQRPYVWDETEQWQPFWEDVRRTAELRLSGVAPGAQHFLGAVVLQAQERGHGTIDASNIIDGQQRLTTLQLLVDAAGAVFTEVGQHNLAGQMEALTHNDVRFAAASDDLLKLRHSNRDRGAFEEVMLAPSPVSYTTLDHRGSKIARAHEFFATVVTEWLAESPTSTADRAQHLAQTLTQGLSLVVIDLQAHENSQEIFETLNARGTPLTAADLIRNLVFQRLDAEGADTRTVYSEVWPFERKFWDSDLRFGNLSLSRSSLFLNQWLVARTAEDISPKQTFTRFKSFVEHESTQPMTELLREIRSQADRYEQWTRAAEDPDRDLDVVETAMYRMKAANLELLKPVLLWLHSPEREVPEHVVEDVVRLVEGWFLRRSLLRLPTTSLGRTVADMLRALRSVPSEQLPETVEKFIVNLNVRGTYLPSDREIRVSLKAEPIYQRFPRPRLRMLLEAIEDHLRSPYDAARVPRRGYPIEHLLPQQWKEHWGVDPAGEADRAAHVHRLGNLTLLTRALNSAVSNGPWLGTDGKWARLHANDVLLMNRRLLELSATTWDELAIDARTEAMVDALLSIWPAPPGHEGVVEGPRSRKNAWVQLRDLLAAGLLDAGTVVHAPARFAETTAVVMEDGSLELNGVRHHSVSRAAGALTGNAVNGWSFWTLEDGRRLSDLRAVYQGARP